MLPLELFKDFITKRIRVHISDEGSYTGTLKGFDNYVNIVLSNATFLDADGVENKVQSECIINGQYITHVETILEGVDVK